MGGPLLGKDDFAVNEYVEGFPVGVDENGGDGWAFEMDVVEGRVTVEQVEGIAGINEEYCISSLLLETLWYCVNSCFHPCTLIFAIVLKFVSL